MTATQTNLNHSLHTAGWMAPLCVIVLFLAQAAAGADDVDRDLQGILPEYIPNGLSEGDFAELSDTWSQWARETGRLVSDFYASENNEVRGRQATLEAIESRLETMRAALEDPQYLGIHGTLSDLYGRLSRRIGLARALLETVQQDVPTPSTAHLDSTLDDLTKSAQRLRTHFGEYDGGDKWAGYLRLDDIASVGRQRDASNETLLLIDSVRQKLSDRERLDPTQRQFLSSDPVQDFENSVNGFVSLVHVDDQGSRQQELRDLAATLMEAVEVYEGEPTSENMSAVRHAFDELRRLTPDGAKALTLAMRRHYLNYNFRVTLDEALAQDLIRDTRMESGFINEMVSKARITGCQWTNTTVNLDLKPSDSGARFDLVLDGTVRSNVQGETHVATVYASGRHCFNGRKAVVFDGDRFSSWPARVGVGGSNYPYAAKTCVSWLPLLGGFTENVAMNVAGSEENNQMARNKVYQEARSQFDRETVNTLNKAELKLQSDLAGPLREEGYYPDVKRFTSTETELLMQARVLESGELGGSDALPLPIYPTHGVLVQIHESLLNQVGDRLELDGKRFTPEQFNQYVREKLEKILGQPVSLAEFGSSASEQPEDSPKVEEVIFHEADALRAQIRGGEVILILSVGLKLEGREEIEPQRISVPLQITLAGDQIHVARGTVGVSPIGRVAPRDRAQQITRAGIMRTKIEEAFKPKELDAVLETTIQDKTVRLRVTDLRANGGWLSIIATDGVTEAGTPTDGTLGSRKLQYVHGPESTAKR